MKLIVKRVKKIKSEIGDKNLNNSTGYALYYLEVPDIEEKLYGILWDNFPNQVILTISSKLELQETVKEIEIFDTIVGDIQEIPELKQHIKYF